MFHCSAFVNICVKTLQTQLKTRHNSNLASDPPMFFSSIFNSKGYDVRRHCWFGLKLHSCELSNIMGQVVLHTGAGMVGWCRKSWVNFQCRGVVLSLIIVGQGSFTLAVGATGGCLDIFSLVCLCCFLSSSFEDDQI